MYARTYMYMYVCVVITLNIYLLQKVHITIGKSIITTHIPSCFGQLKKDYNIIIITSGGVNSYECNLLYVHKEL